MLHTVRTTASFWSCLVLIAGLAALTPGSIDRVQAQDQTDPWTSVTVIYTSDIKGHIEPCG